MTKHFLLTFVFTATKEDQGSHCQGCRSRRKQRQKEGENSFKMLMLLFIAFRFERN
jgi:hypothetical protein